MLLEDRIDKKIQVVGPSGIKNFILGSFVAWPKIIQYIDIVELQNANLDSLGGFKLVDNKRYKIEVGSIRHSIKTYGYVFTEKEKESSGDIHQFVPRKIVILGDTCDPYNISEIAKECTLLVHETSFLGDSHEDIVQARVKRHSTSEMTAVFAKTIKAKNLAVTHFSARYKEDFIFSYFLKFMAQFYSGNIFIARDFLKLIIKPNHNVKANDSFLLDSLVRFKRERNMTID